MDISGNFKPSCIQTSSFFCCRPDQLHYNRAADYREKLEVANWGTGLPSTKLKSIITRPSKMEVYLDPGLVWSEGFRAVWNN